jgi:hypothetical protein
VIAKHHLGSVQANRFDANLHLVAAGADTSKFSSFRTLASPYSWILTMRAIADTSFLNGLRSAQERSAANRRVNKM